MPVVQAILSSPAPTRHDHCAELLENPVDGACTAISAARNFYRLTQRECSPRRIRQFPRFSATESPAGKPEQGCSASRHGAASASAAPSRIDACETQRAQYMLKYEASRTVSDWLRSPLSPVRSATDTSMEGYRRLAYFRRTCLQGFSAIGLAVLLGAATAVGADPARRLPPAASLHRHQQRQPRRSSWRLRASARCGPTPSIRAPAVQGQDRAGRAPPDPRGAVRQDRRQGHGRNRRPARRPTPDQPSAGRPAART